MPDQVISGESAIYLKPSQANGEFESNDVHNYYDYDQAHGVYDRLIEGWLSISGETNRQRALRYVKDCDSLDLREAGIIKDDELYTPIRLIDANIRAEMPALVQYITQSRRSIIFDSLDGAPIDGVQSLEQDFTTKARYLKWEIPWIQVGDGSLAHGWDSVEVIFDPEYPGNFCIEHIGHDRLIFSTDSEDIEAQEVVVIKKMLTSSQLKTMAGFNKEQIDKLINANQQSAGTTDCNNECFKIFFKQDGIIHTCWYGKMCDGYLRNPEPLFQGRRDFTAAMLLEEGSETPDYPPIYEKTFPVFSLKYIESNDPRIIELVGRVKLDEPSQEAASAIQSGMVNGTMRASNVMASPRGDALNRNPNAIPSMTDKIVGNGRLWDQPMDFFHTPYPEASVVQFLNAVVTQNKQEQGQGISFATLNRKDSGKTATEIQAATTKAAELGSVQVILLSVFIREVYARCWSIYQNRVLQGKIIIKNMSLLALFGGDDMEVDPVDGRVISCREAKKYIVKSSGDIDVVQRQEKLQRLMQGWEVFGKTAIASEYLKDIIRYAFPEDAARYVSILDSGVANEADALKQLLMKVSSVLQAVIVDPQTGQIIPSAQPLQQQLAQLAQQVMMAVSGGQGGQQSPQNVMQLET